MKYITVIKKNVLWIIDILIIVFISIEVQSAVCGIHPENFPFYSLKRQLFDALYHYKYEGWAFALRMMFGPAYELAKFLLFNADIYAIVKKIQLLVKNILKPIPARFLIVNFLFAYLKLAEFWEAASRFLGG